MQEFVLVQGQEQAVPRRAGSGQLGKRQPGVSVVERGQQGHRVTGPPAPRREPGPEPAPVPWPWVFSFDQPKLAGYHALVAVRLERPADALAAFADSLSATQPAPKQRATIMLEVATAARQDGIRKNDIERIDESFRLAAEALGIGIACSSERVIEKARRFRRDYAGPGTSHVRSFDNKLRSTLL